MKATDSDTAPRDVDERHQLTEADLPTPYEPDYANLKTEGSYGEAAFALLKEASELVVWLVYGIPLTPFQRNEAIRRGLLKRLSLLGKSLLADISENSGYQQLQIVRQIVETASNYLYLAEDDSSGTRHDAFINHSLAEEKDNLRVIASQIKARGTDVLPIEERMRRSIERMASAAGVDFKAVPAKRESGWPNSVERLKALSPTAYPAYRGGSSALHAGWSVLLSQDIEEVEGGFSLENSIGPRVQPMTAAGQVIAETAIHYLEREGTDAEKAWFFDRLADVAARIRELDERHEQLTQSR